MNSRTSWIWVLVASGIGWAWIFCLVWLVSLAGDRLVSNQWRNGFEDTIWFGYFIASSASIVWMGTSAAPLKIQSKASYLTVLISILAAGAYVLGFSFDEGVFLWREFLLALLAGFGARELFFRIPSHGYPPA